MVSHCENGEGIGDILDPDVDGDGVDNEQDDFPDDLRQVKIQTETECQIQLQAIQLQIQHL